VLIIYPAAKKGLSGEKEKGGRFMFFYLAEASTSYTGTGNYRLSQGKS
jgi:hypothetical protein